MIQIKFEILEVNEEIILVGVNFNGLYNSMVNRGFFGDEDFIRITRSEDRTYTIYAENTVENRPELLRTIAHHMGTVYYDSGSDVRYEANTLVDKVDKFLEESSITLVNPSLEEPTNPSDDG